MVTAFITLEGGPCEYPELGKLHEPCRFCSLPKPCVFYLLPLFFIYSPLSREVVFQVGGHSLYLTKVSLLPGLCLCYGDEEENGEFPHDLYVAPCSTLRDPLPL